MYIVFFCHTSVPSCSYNMVHAYTHLSSVTTTSTYRDVQSCGYNMVHTYAHLSICSRPLRAAPCAPRTSLAILIRLLAFAGSPALTVLLLVISFPSSCPESGSLGALSYLHNIGHTQPRELHRRSSQSSIINQRMGTMLVHLVALSKVRPTCNFSLEQNFLEPGRLRAMHMINTYVSLHMQRISAITLSQKSNKL